MTPQTEKNSSKSVFKSPLYRLGLFSMVLGASILGYFLAEEFKNTVENRNYYVLIALGAVIAVKGAVIMFIARRRTRKA